ncbi:uncharacterized protein EI90DRAFT_2914434 [Cantharellus anzutake]|uniref:uncharacterized protein n=1 Tax=Cantharellus anzutake TaxID=1750568 RepID=UPI0019051A0A|nr:uncharacterized protein EI90DRAFT_2914434 [Cantharellus anzutake]KAF8334956.1 hypothetical protein EI90DRAFT_2914434 [Cantharellus anzutake]
MALSVRPVVEAGNAVMCTVISVFGVLILSSGFLGYGFDHHWEALMGSTADPENGAAAARLCYHAAIVYAVLVAFCGCQVRCINYRTILSWY